MQWPGRCADTAARACRAWRNSRDRFRDGDKVRALDLGNIGTIKASYEDGTYDVHFRSKEGNERTKRMTDQDLEPLEKRKRKTKKRTTKQPSGDEGPPFGEPARGECGESGECVSGRPQIEITTEEHEVNAQAAAVLERDQASVPAVALLVRIVGDTSPAAKASAARFPLRIEPLPMPILRERLAANAQWVEIRETDQGTQEKPARPPCWCVSAVHARGDWPGVRHLEAVVDHPVLRPDGTVLDRPGYDLDTGLLLEYCGEGFVVQPFPSHSDSLAALNSVLDLVADFPFKSPCHRSAWIASLLTPLCAVCLCWTGTPIPGRCQRLRSRQRPTTGRRLAHHQRREVHGCNLYEGRGRVAQAHHVPRPGR